MILTFWQLRDIEFHICKRLKKAGNSATLWMEPDISYRITGEARFGNCSKCSSKKITQKMFKRWWDFEMCLIFLRRDNCWFVKKCFIDLEWMSLTFWNLIFFKLNLMFSDNWEKCNNFSKFMWLEMSKIQYKQLMKLHFLDEINA